MSDKQPDALRLAEHLENFRSFPADLEAAAELRRLHAECEALRSAQSQAQAEAVPRTHVLVPKRMTRAMERVTEEEGWAWADLLAAAESITEAEYGEIQMDDATPQQAEAVPPGYVLVPVEPTNEFLQAVYDLRIEVDGGGEQTLWPSEHFAIYRAMIAAAIAQQKGTTP